MRNDSSNDRRRRVPLAKDVSFLQAAEAIKVLLHHKWKWDGRRWHEPQECSHCDSVVFEVDANMLCTVCAERYAKENGY